MASKAFLKGSWVKYIYVKNPLNLVKKAQNVQKSSYFISWNECPPVSSKFLTVQWTLRYPPISSTDIIYQHLSLINSFQCIERTRLSAVCVGLWRVSTLLERTYPKMSTKVLILAPEINVHMIALRIPQCTVHRVKFISMYWESKIVCVSASGASQPY